MTAIIKTGQPTDSQIVIPPNIVTLEQLATWVLRAMWEMHKVSEFFPDKNDVAVRRIQRSPFVNGAGKPTILWSLYLTYDPSFGIDKTKKEWMFTDEISNIVPSPAFNTD